MRQILIIELTLCHFLLSKGGVTHIGEKDQF